MSKFLNRLILAPIMALSLVAQPMLAAETTTTTTPAAADPQGLGSAYNFQTEAASSTKCGDPHDYCYGHANENAVTIMKNFNQKLAAMQLAIVEAMRLGTGQISGNLREGTGAEHTLADQQDDRATVKAVEEARLQALRDATSGTTSCYVFTGSQGGSSLKASAAKAAVAYSTDLDKWVRGESEFSKEGQDKARYYKLEAYCNSYATQADVDAKLCKSVSKLPAASIDASQSLFYRGDAGSSDTYDADRAKAANAFILNALASETFTPPDPAEATSPEGRRQAARYKDIMARDSIGRSITVQFAKEHDPQSAGGTLMGWAAARANKINIDGANIDKGISYQQWLAIYAKGFLLDTESLMASDQDPVTAAKDMKNMMAVLTYMAYEIYSQNQLTNVQLATTNAILGEQSRTDGIFKKNGS
jgi:hypothetical protein